MYPLLCDSFLCPPELLYKTVFLMRERNVKNYIVSKQPCYVMYYCTGLCSAIYVNNTFSEISLQFERQAKKFKDSVLKVNILLNLDNVTGTGL